MIFSNSLSTKRKFKFKQQLQQFYQNNPQREFFACHAQAFEAKRPLEWSHPLKQDGLNVFFFAFLGQQR